MPKIRWGLIGASTIARSLAAAIAENDGIVTAIMSHNPDRAQKFAAEFAIPHYFTSVERMLADAPLDAVYISSTNEHHYSQTLAASSAKKHVLCEKPIGLTLAEAKEMIAACRAACVILGTNHHLRHAPAHGIIRRLVTEGAIGQVLFARVFHATYLPENLQGWRLDRPDAGGGVALDIVTHDIDTLRFVLGAEPLAATAMEQSGIMSKNNLADGMMGVVAFDQGILAQIHAAFTTKYAGNGLELHGTKGSIFGRNVMSQRTLGDVMLRTERGEEIFTVARENLYGKIIARFHQAIEGKAAFAASGEDGMRALAASLALVESCRTRQTVPILI